MSIAPLDVANAETDTTHPAAATHHDAGLVLCARPATLTGDDIKAAVALHVAATLLPASASVTTREQVRTNWYAALKPVTGIHTDWALAYVPGVHHGDNETYAVHLHTGRVFGGVGHPSGQRRGESTQEWVTRLTTLIPAA